MQAVATTWFVAVAAASLVVLLVLGVVAALVYMTGRIRGHSVISIDAHLMGFIKVRVSVTPTNRRGR